MEIHIATVGSIIATSSQYALLAIGFGLLYRVNKFFDLSYAAYILLGMYIYVALTFLHISPILAFVATLIATTTFAICIDKSIYQRLFERKSSGALMLVASLGVFMVTQATLTLFFGTEVFSGQTTVEKILLWKTAAITQTQLLSFMLAFGICAAIFTLLQRTQLGLHIRAVADDLQLAYAYALPVANTRTITTVLATIAGVSGALFYMFTFSLEPALGMTLLTKGAIVSLVALGSIPMTVVVATLLAIAEFLTIWHIGAEWKDTIVFLLLTIFLVLSNVTQK